MIIDQEDLQPRPADDYHAGIVKTFRMDTAPSLARLSSFTDRFFENKPEICDQLGVPFFELPHTQLP